MASVVNRLRYDGPFVILPHHAGFPAIYAQQARLSMVRAIRKTVVDREMEALRLHVELGNHAAAKESLRFAREMADAAAHH